MGRVRRTPPAVGLLIAAGLVLWPRALAAQEPLPSVEQILRKTIERAQWAEEQKFDSKYAYRQHSVQEELDNQGKLKKRRDTVYQVFPIEDVPYRRAVLKDGQPLSARELKEEQKRERKFRAALAKEKKKPPQPKKKDDDDIEFNEEVAAKYHFTLLGRETLEGRPVFVLAFEPKAKDLPVRRRIDNFLNRVAGKLWIDEQEHEIARGEVRLLEPVRLWSGVLGTLRRLELLWEQARLEDGAWLTRHVAGEMSGRVLFKSLNLRLNSEYADFQKVTPEIARRQGLPGE